MRLIIVSNRAPVTVVRGPDGIRYEPSSGGLATGLRAFVERQRATKNPLEIVWVGWPGVAVEPNEQPAVERHLLDRFGVLSVFLPIETMERFYQGFCNKTIWPLFHYFPSYSSFDQELWQEYIAVNQIFAERVLAIAQPGDIIWVQDYHLMLLPKMLRAKLPNSTIGFFLHIPFPSYEVFRLLPSDCRPEILEGLYGSDLIGFHTRDYSTYFLRSTLRILGVEDRMGEVFYDERVIKIDALPMGIDYERFHSAPERPEVQAEIAALRKHLGDNKIVLSIDRQDYTKGISNRLEGYDLFLESNPEWRQKVTLVMVVIPSRAGVEDYQTTKSHIDETIGKINGRYGTLDWTPILYQYRSISFPELSALYNTSDVALVTPLRDGMNLIAKEYVASRTNNRGVLILSEMAGAVDELDASIIINPNNREEIATALLEAFEMSEEEQGLRIELMQKRIERFDVVTWAETFLADLQKIKKEQRRLSPKTLGERDRTSLVTSFRRAASRLLFLDYDGTLTSIVRHPSEAAPSKELLTTLREISEVPNTRVVIISGRDRRTLDEWFAGIPVDLAAEHGLLVKKREGQWTRIKGIREVWKGRLLPRFKRTSTKRPKVEVLQADWTVLKPVREYWQMKLLPLLKHYVDRLPGSFIEEKDFSLAFHFRESDPEASRNRIREMVHHLRTLTNHMDLQLFQGKKVLEIRNAGIDKGVAALHWLSEVSGARDFILSIGDDTTDEDLFRVMPQGAYSIKVGSEASNAMYNVEGPRDVLGLLRDFLVL
jgi:trehalose 6-phosphate synthase/phosphatase